MTHSSMFYGRLTTHVDETPKTPAFAEKRMAKLEWRLQGMERWDGVLVMYIFPLR